MKNYIELKEIGLNYYSVGVEKKIVTLIVENLKPKIEYIEVENDIRYTDHNSQRKAYFAGYSKTYTKKVPSKYFYSINQLIKLFKTHTTIEYKRQKYEINCEKFLNTLYEIKKD